MKSEAWETLRRVAEQWKPPEIPEAIPQGDMPGDQIRIDREHIQKANVLFPALLPMLEDVARENPHRRAVVAICGGSGVGKSEIASLISYYLRKLGIGSYTLSGDNYPYRIPEQNDAERLRVFRYGGLRGLLASGQWTSERQEALRELQRRQVDADPALVRDCPWLDIYQGEGSKALAEYLGSGDEIDFDAVTGIVARFKNGASHIPLKRMGRAPADIWYDTVDFRGVGVLVMEWTHSNSDRFRGVDIPILLNSTPKETLAHRKSRNRDGNADSAFTALVLSLEQKLLEKQAVKAKLIVSKSGELLSYQAYRRFMAEAVDG